MKVKAIRGHFADKEVRAVGDVYEVDDRLATELLGAGKVISAPGTKRKPKTGPMTTTSVPELVTGKGDKNAEL